MKLSEKSWVSVGMLLTALGVTVGSVSTVVSLQKDAFALQKDVKELKDSATEDRREMRDMLQGIYQRLRSIENNVSEINGALKRREK